MILISKKQKRQLYVELFKNGVMVVNDYKYEKKISNFITIQVMNSLLSKGFVKKQYTWRVYYFTITEKGVDFIKSYLNFPSYLVPKTYEHNKGVIA